jgi:hypothetical protein
MKSLILLLAMVCLETRANVCAKDAKKFCQGVGPGKGQLAKCLSDYEGSLTPVCAKGLKDFKKNTAKKNPCFEDLTDLCTNVPSEPGKLELCLLKNESRLSSTCAADFKRKKGNLIVRNVCANDIIANCYTEVSSDDGSINHCLIRKRAKLTGLCKKKTEERVAEMRKKNACFDETEKFCPSFVRVSDIQDCLEKKIPSLSVGCKQIVQNEIAKGKANPCYKDLTRHCVPNLPPKQQYECLGLNENHLSNACRQFRVLEKIKIEKMVTVCENDRLKLCANEPFENGRVLKCLKVNKTKISKNCASLL